VDVPVNASSPAPPPSDREIVITRTFDAPRTLVFEAWTRCEHVSQWWDPGGAPLASCEIDLRPNGAFRWVNQTANGQEHAFAGTYREIRPPERIVFSTRTGRGGEETIGTLDFREHDGKTTLTLTMTCASIAGKDALLQMRVDAGTMKTLANLAAYLRTIE
jgi:uncharacterized protein YndB with AHSA1/START domain